MKEHHGKSRGKPNALNMMVVKSIDRLYCMVLSLSAWEGVFNENRPFLFAMATLQRLSFKSLQNLVEHDFTIAHRPELKSLPCYISFKAPGRRYHGVHESEMDFKTDHSH